MKYGLTVSIALAMLAAGCKESGSGACDLAAPDCASDEVCLAEAGATEGVCTPRCDPALIDSCGADRSCDAVVGGGYACFDPVYFLGAVFDSADGSPIEGATVLAADATGIVVTEVARSDAEGTYELRVPVVRDAYGVPVDGTFTLRVGAADYLPFPYGIRPALPITVDTSTAVFVDPDGDGVGRYEVRTVTTDAALIALETGDQGRPSVSGTVGGASAGALVVAECTRALDEPPCPYAFADVDGAYVIFNVPNGTYTVRAYKADLQVTPEEVTVSDADVANVDLARSEAPFARVTGSLQFVNPMGGQATSVVMAPTSTFFQLAPTFIRAEIAPGLRAPEPGIAPNLTAGSYMIDGIPEGEYELLAAYENDRLVRDPNPDNGGTEIIGVTVPDAVMGVEITAGGFKITGAIDIVSPGGSGPEAVMEGESLTLTWTKDPGTDHYVLFVYDAFGNEAITPVTIDDGNQVSAPYTGPLEVGMYYQWRVVSYGTNGNELATSEDLRGVFYVVPATP